MPNDVLIKPVLFIVLVLILSLYGLAASGHFPRAHRRAPLSSGSGSAILYGSIAVSSISALAALFAGFRLTPWYVAVIGGGLALLSAPLVLQKFSDAFVDGRAALIWFAGSAMILAFILLRMS